MEENKMKELIIKTQQEFDSIPNGFRGIVYITNATERIYVRENRGKFIVDARDNSSVEAWENSSVMASGNSSVDARDNSSVDARDNSSVVAMDNSSVMASGNSSVDARDNSSVMASGNSSVEAWENSSVMASGNSSVDARDNSSVDARDNSSVVAMDNSSVMASGNSSVDARDNSSVMASGNSSVEAWDNSSVKACGNVQVVDRLCDGSVETVGNSRIVYMPKTIEDFCDFYGIKVTNGKGLFYKAVREDLKSYYDNTFQYEIGKISCVKCDDDTKEGCSSGLNISYLDWALKFGKSNISGNWKIIECEIYLKDIVLSDYSDGKVRASKLKVLREVPLEECGLFVKMIKKSRGKI